MFKEVSTQIDFVAQEHDVLRFWDDINAFEKLRQLRHGAPLWSFIDGPITANNPMGVHHGWGRTYKDLFHRYYVMKGFNTRFQNGFDCQGLWVEVNVEREMGFTSKHQIEEFGLRDFVLLCKQRVLKYAAVQTEQSQRLGYWMDWNDPDELLMLRDKLAEDPSQEVTLEGPDGPVTDSAEMIVGRLGMPELGGSYFTFSNENNYTIWSALKSCHDRGWIYKGRDVMPWCARCGTGLSQHEIVTEGYQELTHASITLKFPLVDKPGESLLIWTTTPWTLTSNVAAAVGPELKYARVRQGDETFYLSQGTLSMLRGEYVVESVFDGQEMEGWHYRGPFDELEVPASAGVADAHRVILWDEVGEEEGTGIVHIAPGCGAEDFALSKEFGLPVVAPLSENGIFFDGFGFLSGMDVNQVAQEIFDNLKEKELVYKIEDYTHRYPVCWRCSEELVFRLVDEWFISMGEQLDKPYHEITKEEKETNLRYQIMEVVTNETNWYPSFGFDRELDWLRNMHDWMISKKRYWGLALPIWECHECGSFEVIGSREELKDRAVEGWDQFEGHTPHRPHVDGVKIECQNCRTKIARIPDVGNPWLDAGVVAMSTLQYDDDRKFWGKWFPADLISESFPGQFRNWFYSLLAMSTILERRAPFKHVFTYATLLAEDGREMHKSAGNSIEFNEAADKMGVDVMRWMYCDHKPEKDLLFGYGRADLVRKQFLIPLWNVYSFFVTYANIDNWEPDTNANYKLRQLDRWILSRLAEVMHAVTRRLDRYEPDMATSVVNRFIDDLSNWYLRRSRRRFWASKGASKQSDQDKQAAYHTLYTVLVTLGDLLAPFVPFVTETIYQNLVRQVDPEAAESVHHRQWPEPQEGWLDEKLNQEMELVKRLVSLGHAARNQANRKLRQPLSEAAMAVGTASDREIVEQYQALISEELNVKTVRLLDTAAEAVDYQLKPLPKQLGQKYGSQFPPLREAILALDPLSTAERLLAGETIEVAVGKEEFTILPEEVEVLIEAHEGFSAAADGAYVAALDVELTDALINEGLAREFVRRVQDLRRQADLKVDDRIIVEYQATPKLAEAITAHTIYIEAETLADSLSLSEKPSGQASAKHQFDSQSLEVALSEI